MTDAGAPLAVTADLTLEAEGTTAEIRSAGDHLFVEIGSIADAIRLFRRSPTGIEDRLRPVLGRTALTVEIRVRGRTVAVSGADSRPGVLSRRAGVAPDELRVGGALSAVGAEVSAALGAGRRLVRSIRPD